MPRRVALVVLLLALFLGAPDAARALGALARVVVHDVNVGPVHGAGLRQPGYGAQVLPPAAREIAELARAHGVTTYWASPRFLQDDLIAQRLVEGAWPARRADQPVPDRFYGKGEAPPAGCETRAQRAAVTYVVCR